MPILHAIILGLVEGITEYLPISSTGHLVLTGALLGLNSEDQKQAIDAFIVVIQGGAILAVLGLYRARVAQMLRGLIGRDPAGLRLCLNLIIAFIPAAVAGFLLHDHIERVLFRPWPVLLALLVGGVYMIVIDQLRARRVGVWKTSDAPEIDVTELTPGRALLIGLMQCVAMWPGTSRSMMTITGGMIARLKPGAAAEFSFLLGLPTLGAATAYAFLKDFKHAHDTCGPTMIERLGGAPVAIGILAATVSAALAVKWLVGFLNRRGLSAFGWYRIALCGVLGVLITRGVVSIEPPAETPSAESGL